MLEKQRLSDLKSVTKEALDSAEWRDFEEFAIFVLSKYYERFGVKLQATRKQDGGATGGDGGRDGEAAVLLANDIKNRVPSRSSRQLHIDRLNSLDVLVVIWAEVKKRSAENIDHHDVGGSLFLSSNQYVTKTIFVTNRNFTEGFKEHLKVNALRHDRQFGLVDGEQFLELANAILSKSTETPSALPPATKKKITEIDIKARLFFSKISGDITFVSNITHGVSLIGEPVFITAQVAVISLPAIVKRMRVKLIYHGPLEISNISENFGCQQTAVDQGDLFSASFLLVPMQEGTLKVSDFSLVLHHENQSTCIDPAIELTEPKWHIRGTILPRYIPPSRKAQIDQIGTLIEQWVEHGGHSSLNIVAIAGAGKSFLLEEVRNIWLKKRAGIKEIRLDGGREQGDREVALEILRQSFPVTFDSLTIRNSPYLTKWLVELGISETDALALAESLIPDTEATTDQFNSAKLGYFVAMILASRATVESPLVVSFEDLHKCFPSALKFLQALRRHLGKSSSSFVFTIFTTRQNAIWDDKNIESKWLNYFAELSREQSTHVVELDVFTREDSFALLQAAIPTLETHHAQLIVEQVGKTPFALREALAYLKTENFLVASDKPGQWYLAELTAFEREIATEKLRDATRVRIESFFRRSPSWFADFLYAGSCLGSSFDIEASAVASKVPNYEKLEEFLHESQKFAILKPSSRLPTQVDFDHDLVRKAVLSEMGSFRQRRLAGELYNALDTTASLELKSSLSYQAGLAEHCWHHSIEQAHSSQATGHHLEAVHAIGLALAVTDDNVASTLFNVQRGRYKPTFDEAIATAAHCTRDLRPLERDHAITRLLVQYGESLIAVGSSGSEAVVRLITEGHMLSERLKDQESLAFFTLLRGRYALSNNDAQRSLDFHSNAERIFCSIKDLSLSSERFRAMNMIRTAIAQRQLGDLEASRRTLLRAARHAPRGDWALMSKVRSNFGATYFYLSWARVRKHWERAFEIAFQHNLPDRFVHCLIDLAQINLFDERYVEACKQLEKAARWAQEYGYQNSELRVLLNLGCAELIRDEPQSALNLLLEAEKLGLRHSNPRRLWRVRANIATCYFLLGKLERSYVADLQVLRILKDQLENLNDLSHERPSEGTRYVLALGNIGVRSFDSPKHSEIVRSLEDSARKIAMFLARAASENRLESIPGQRGKFCKSILGKHFYLVNE